MHGDCVLPRMTMMTMVAVENNPVDMHLGNTVKECKQ